MEKVTNTTIHKAQRMREDDVHHYFNAYKPEVQGISGYDVFYVYDSQVAELEDFKKIFPTQILTRWCHPEQIAQLHAIIEKNFNGKVIQYFPDEWNQHSQIRPGFWILRRNP